VTKYAPAKTGEYSSNIPNFQKKIDLHNKGGPDKEKKQEMGKNALMHGIFAQEFFLRPCLHRWHTHKKKITIVMTLLLIPYSLLALMKI